MKRVPIIDGKKQCTLCQEWKDVNLFTEIKPYKDGTRRYRSWCKKCRGKYDNGTNDIKEKWLKAFPEKRNKAVKTFNIKARHGMSLEEYEAVMTGAVCGICGEDGKNVSLHLDHNHATGEFRGVLCQRCNQALGLLDDDISKFEKAIAWLRDDGLV